MRQYDALVAHFDEIASFEHALSMLGWDWSTMMPAGGAENRATTMSHLKAFSHRLLTRRDLPEMMDKASGENLNDMEKANLERMRHHVHIATALPEELVRAISQQASKTEHAWRTLRKENNWQDFMPLLKDMVSLVRQKAAVLADASGLPAYDAMMQEYEPGLMCSDIDPLFADLAAFLPDFTNRVIDQQKSRTARLPDGPFAIADQEKLGKVVMQQMGFNFDHGRLDTSTHPFCSGVVSDTRLTTRYSDDDWYLALLGIIHESGHALYQQNQPSVWQRQPVGQARGMAVHESQSLLFEMQIARGRAFSQWLAPIAREAFGADAGHPAWQAENLYRLSTKVERGFIRVDADECTYPCHVMMRYGMEKDFINGTLEVEHLPDRWHADMQKLLGLSTLGNDRNGCMQDIHWTYGAMGYFPTYTLGALMAAQLMAALRTQTPDIDKQIAAGDFTAVSAFMRQHIWQHGSRYSMQELVEKATGNKLGTDAFKAHLQQRYIDEAV